MLKEKLKMMNGVLENGNYQLGQFQFAERSAAMKAPVGLLSDSRWNSLAPTSSQMYIP